MKLNIRYFASIREQLGITQETIDIDVPELRIDTLRATLAARHRWLTCSHLPHAQRSHIATSLPTVMTACSISLDHVLL
jgi:molybdopterin converting factor small subunit